MAEPRLPDEAARPRAGGARARDARGTRRGPPAARPGAGPARPPRSRCPPATRASIAIGADHGGFALKGVLAKHLADQGFGVTDCGTTGTDAVDYPDFAHVVARLVAERRLRDRDRHRRRRHRLRDGRQQGARACAPRTRHDISMARNAREHNYANVLTLGARMIGEGLALEIVDTFLATPWGARAARRGGSPRSRAIEQRYRRPGRTDQEPAR